MYENVNDSCSHIGIIPNTDCMIHSRCYVLTLLSFSLHLTASGKSINHGIIERNGVGFQGKFLKGMIENIVFHITHGDKHLLIISKGQEQILFRITQKNTG